MLVKKEKAICMLIVIMLLFSFCNAAFADEASISHVVIEVGEENVIFTLDEYETAIAAGVGNDIYDYMAAGNVPRVSAVRSGDKFMAIGVYGLAFAEAGNIAEAIGTSPAQGDVVETYKVFGGFDGQGDPILFPLFHAVTFGVSGGSGALTAKVEGEPITSGAQVQEGSDVVFTATPDDGYRVKAWKLGEEVISGATGSTYIVANLSSNIEVTVEFEAIPPVCYEVTFSVTGGNGELTAQVGGTAITSVAQVVYGSDVEFTALPDQGYRVKKWKQNDEVVTGATGSTYTVENLSSDIEVTVEFEAITAQVSELYRDGVSALYEGTVYNGIRELVGGVYNVELEMSKITAKFGDISGYSLRLIIDDEAVQGEDGDANIIDTFIVEEEYAVLPAVQQGIQDEGITINPATLAEAIVLMIE